HMYTVPPAPIPTLGSESAGVGMLSGPAVIGWMTHLTALNHTFLLLTLLCVIAAAAAGVLRTGPDRRRAVTRSSHRQPVRHDS
ncbi:hypothetical protein ACWDAZ_28440, partial [Streptomyces sp. NPDC001215]